MKPTSDYHIHTCLRPWDDGAPEMNAKNIAKRARELGCKKIGISPHIHIGCDLVQVMDFLKHETESAAEILPVFKGVETECIAEDGTLSIDANVVSELDYIIASPDHYNCEGVVRPPKPQEQFFEFHQQLLLALAQNPLVDVIAHPWAALILLTCDGHLPGYPHIEDLKDIPESWHCKLAQTAKANNTAVEISGFFVGTYLRRRTELNQSYAREYFRFFEIMAEEGVLLSPSSDAHRLEELQQCVDAWNVIDKLGIPSSQIWHPCKKS